MSRIDPHAQALAIATTELATALHRAVGEIVDAHPDWSTTEALAVVATATARVTTSVANDALRAEHHETGGQQ